MTTHPATSSAEEYGRGDCIAWHASRMHGAGTGMIVRVLPLNGGRTRYEALKMIYGLSTGEYVLLEEGEFYPTRSLRDNRPRGHGSVSRRPAAPRAALAV